MDLIIGLAVACITFALGRAFVGSGTDPQQPESDHQLLPVSAAREIIADAKAARASVARYI